MATNAAQKPEPRERETASGVVGKSVDVVQPTTYTWAAAHNGLILPNSDGEFIFEYKVLVRRSKPVAFQTVTVRRTVGTFTWLERITQNIVALMENLGFENEWPLNDHSALCGPKWCPFWSQCKGQYVNGDWT